MKEEMKPGEMRSLFLDCYGNKVRGNMTPEGMWNVIEKDILAPNDCLSLDFVDVENMIGGDVTVADGIVVEGHPNNLPFMLDNAFQQVVSLHPDDHPRKVLIFLEQRMGLAAESSFTIIDFITPLDDGIDFTWGMTAVKRKMNVKLIMLIGFN